jgi:hypothetical protein
MKILNKLLNVFTIIFIVSIIIAFVFPENLEIRSTVYQVIFDGYITIISLLILLILLVLKGVYYLINEKWIEGFLLVSITGIFLFFCIFMFSLFLGDIGVFKEDVIVYENQKHYIVFQYFETGITGNPNSRILRIEGNLNSSIRKFEEIKLKDYDSIDFIDFSNIKANCNSIPNTIKYNGIEYKLKICK